MGIHREMLTDAMVDGQGSYVGVNECKATRRKVLDKKKPIKTSRMTGLTRLFDTILGDGSCPETSFIRSVQVSIGARMSSPSSTEEDSTSDISVLAAFPATMRDMVKFGASPEYMRQIGSKKQLYTVIHNDQTFGHGEYIIPVCGEMPVFKQKPTFWAAVIASQRKTDHAYRSGFMQLVQQEPRCANIRAKGQDLEKAVKSASGEIFWLAIDFDDAIHWWVLFNEKCKEQAVPNHQKSNIRRLICDSLSGDRELFHAKLAKVLTAMSEYPKLHSWYTDFATGDSMHGFLASTREMVGLESMDTYAQKSENSNKEAHKQRDGFGKHRGANETLDEPLWRAEAVILAQKRKQYFGHVEGCNEELELEDWCKPSLEISTTDFWSTGYDGRCSLVDQVTGDGIEFIRKVFNTKADGVGLGDAPLVKPLPPLDLGASMGSHLVLSKSILLAFVEYAEMNSIPGYDTREQIKHAFIEAVAILDQRKLNILQEADGAVVGLCSGFNGKAKETTKMGRSGCLADCTKCKAGLCCSKTFAYIIKQCMARCCRTVADSQPLLQKLQAAQPHDGSNNGETELQVADLQQESQIEPTGTCGAVPKVALARLDNLHQALECKSSQCISLVMQKWKTSHRTNFNLVELACRKQGGAGKKGSKNRAMPVQRSAAYHRGAAEAGNNARAAPEFYDVHDTDVTDERRESNYTVAKWNATFPVDLACLQCNHQFERDEIFVQEQHRVKQRQEMTGLEAYSDSWGLTHWCINCSRQHLLGLTRFESHRTVATRDVDRATSKLDALRQEVKAIRNLTASETKSLGGKDQLLLILKEHDQRRQPIEVSVLCHTLVLHSCV